MKNYVVLMLLIVTAFQLSAHDWPKVKVKIKGTGGIVIDNSGNQNICPLKDRSKVCAIVEGSLWDLIKNWLGMVNNTNCEGQSGSMDPNFLLPIPVTVTVTGETTVRHGTLIWVDSSKEPIKEGCDIVLEDGTYLNISFP